MIARLFGRLAEKQAGSVVIDVGGVGYEAHVPVQTLEALGEAGAQVTLHIVTHVREDVLLLFGFASRREKELFLRLVAISGIGPKTALTLLSGLGAPDLIEAVRQRDAARLASIPGVGRKTSERILVELADRIDALEAAGDEAAGASAGGPPGSLRQDLVSALVNLGYNARVAADAAGRVIKTASGTPARFETLLRDSLRLLSR